MKKNFLVDASTIFILVIMLVGVFFYYISIVDFSEQSYKVQVFPMWTSMTLIGLCILELLFSYIKRKRAEKEGNTPVVSAEKKKEGIRIFFGFCWMLSLPLGIMIFGFYITLPLFALVFLRAHKVGWMPSIIVATGVFLLAYFGFGLVLQLRFYPGLLFGGKL